MDVFRGMKYGIIVSAVLWIVILLVCRCFAADVTIKDVPAGISEKQVQEWVSILIERSENAKVNQIPEVTAAVKDAQTNIDTFRKANNLAEKFAAPNPVE
jgi:hypothetical protein